MALRAAVAYTIIARCSRDEDVQTRPTQESTSSNPPRTSHWRSVPDHRARRRERKTLLSGVP
eukprot:9068245-Alexandrium_andersonii.AAC.1